MPETQNPGLKWTLMAWIMDQEAEERVTSESMNKTLRPFPRPAPPLPKDI